MSLEELINAALQWVARMMVYAFIVGGTSIAAVCGVIWWVTR